MLPIYIQLPKYCRQIADGEERGEDLSFNVIDSKYFYKEQNVSKSSNISKPTNKKCCCC